MDEVLTEWYSRRQEGSSNACGVDVVPAGFMLCERTDPYTCKAVELCKQQLIEYELLEEWWCGGIAGFRQQSFADKDVEKS